MISAADWFSHFDLEMTLFKYNLLIGQAQTAPGNAGAPFHKQVESCLLQLCRELNTPIPIWLSQNTEEFGRFHQTVFFAEQFDEPVAFDRMRLKLIERQED